VVEIILLQSCGDTEKGHDNHWCPDLDLNPRSPQQEAGVTIKMSGKYGASMRIKPINIHGLLEATELVFYIRHSEVEISVS
jgi:hypothetical protein